MVHVARQWNGQKIEIGWSARTQSRNGQSGWGGQSGMDGSEWQDRQNWWDGSQSHDRRLVGGVGIMAEHIAASKSTNLLFN